MKFVNVVPGNPSRELTALSSSYILFDASTGEHLALMDGGQITNCRTAAIAALGADFLARKGAETLLIVGAGKVAANIAPAMQAIRPIKKVRIWNRTPATGQNLARQLQSQGFDATFIADLQSGVEGADIISCSTFSKTPLFRGDWLQPGQHLDLIGSFTPKMREADDTAVRRSQVFVDVTGALSESGDIIDPIASGALAPGDIHATLVELCSGAATGRKSEDEITLFKAVGPAQADLAAAKLVHLS